MKKTNVVVDNAKNCRSRTTKRKSSSLFREMATDTQTLLQQQRIKEKQLLKQWKADRAPFFHLFVLPIDESHNLIFLVIDFY